MKTNGCCVTPRKGHEIQYVYQFLKQEPNFTQQGLFHDDGRNSNNNGLSNEGTIFEQQQKQQQQEQSKRSNLTAKRTIVDSNRTQLMKKGTGSPTIFQELNL
jgi:hypothetical protein